MPAKQEKPELHELAEIARRVKAARILASTNETIRAAKLGDQIKEEYGLPADWLPQLERTREGEEPDFLESILPPIERFLKVPRWWLTAPLGEIVSPGGERLEPSLAARLDSIEQRLADLPDELARAMDRLAQGPPQANPTSGETDNPTQKRREDDSPDVQEQR